MSNNQTKTLESKNKYMTFIFLEEYDYFCLALVADNIRLEYFMRL